MISRGAVPIRSVYLTWWRSTSGCMLCSSMYADSVITGVQTYDKVFELNFHIETGESEDLIELLNQVRVNTPPPTHMHRYILIQI